MIIDIPGTPKTLVVLGSKAMLFPGLAFKNRGYLGSIGVYIYTCKMKTTDMV